MEEIKQQIIVASERIESGIDILLATMARGDYDGTTQVLRQIRQTTMYLRNIVALDKEAGSAPPKKNK